MEKKSFNIGEVLKFGWVTFKKNWTLFIGVMILYCLLPAIPYLIGRNLAATHPLWSFLFFVIYIVFALLVSMGLINICLKFSNNEKASVSDLFACWSKMIKYVLAQLFYNIIVVIGLILFIVPGLYWGTRFGLWQFFVIEKNAGPLEALKLSGKTTNGAKWDYFGLLVISFLLTIVGALALFVGLFIAIPVVITAQARAYRTLLANTST